MDFNSQALTEVNIDGGAIDGTPIGANSHSTIKGTTGEFTGVVQLSGEVTCDAQFNQNENLHLASGKDLRLGAGGTCKLNRSGNNVNLIDSVVGGIIGIEAPIIQLKGSTSLQVVECPTINVPPAVTNLADDGSIPITSSLVKIDANGGARTGIRFAGTGTVGQVLYVYNEGGEKLTFHNTEGTALLLAVNASKDTMEPGVIYQFVSTGSLWCYLGGAKAGSGAIGLVAS